MNWDRIYIIGFLSFGFRLLISFLKHNLGASDEGQR